jgi:catechol 2,3-dioxygenase-like lactoylglutathione lyase family enzyme
VYRIPMLAISVAAFCGNTSGQPVKAGLDHVTIVVHDLAAAKRLYSELGFSTVGNGRYPDGAEGAWVNFLTPAATGSLSLADVTGYLELIAPYDATLSGGRRLADFLEQGEGAHSAGLRVASAEQAARDLRAAGLKINGPTAGTVSLDGEKEPPPPRWWNINFVDKVASHPLFLIQYAARPATPPPGFSPPAPHPNSATSLSALLIAVNDIEGAATQYGSIAKVGAREISMPELGATATEMVLEHGSIFLLKATDPGGPTAQRLRARGEGILALKIAVADLGQARKQAEKNVSKNKQQVLVSPENGAGVWLELQRAGQ